MSDVMQYYGVDWLAMLFTLFAIWQLGNRQRWGFVNMIIGNAFWIGLGVFTSSLAMVIANSLFAIMNVRALMKWGEKKAGQAPGAAPGD